MSLPLTDVCVLERPSVKCKNKNLVVCSAFTSYTITTTSTTLNTPSSLSLSLACPFLILMSLVFHLIDV